MFLLRMKAELLTPDRALPGCPIAMPVIIRQKVFGPFGVPSTAGERS